MKISHNKVVLLLVVLVLLLVLSPTVVMANAPAFSYGDVFASVSNGRAFHYSGAGVYLETLDDGLGGFTTGSAFDAAGNFYMTNFSTANVTKFDRNYPHNILQTINCWPQGDASSESIVFDLAGNFYVGNADGNGDIHKYNAAGTFITKYDVARENRGSDWIDLAADQKTMFYTSEGRRIFRYYVSNSTQAADFATLPGSFPTYCAYALRLLPDGGLLVADTQDIKRLNANGSVNRTYDITGENTWFSLNRDPDGTSFWSGNFNTGNIYKFDIDTGTHLQTINTGVGSRMLWGISVYGEKTEGGPSPPTIEVGGDVYPVNRLALLAPWIALIAVIIVGATMAVRRRRTQS